MKKKNLFIAFATVLLIAGCSGKKFKIPQADVPPAVAAAFQQKYPSAKLLEWEAEKEGEDLVYEVGFTINDKKMEAAFKTDGTFIKEE